MTSSVRKIQNILMVIVVGVFSNGFSGAVGYDERAHPISRRGYRADERPWSSHVHVISSITDPNGQVQRYTGSGVLIAPDCVLTSSSNVFHPTLGREMDHIFVRAGQEGGQDVGSATAEECSLHPSFFDPEVGNLVPLAIVKLIQPIPNAGFLPLIASTDEYLEALRDVHTTGYPLVQGVADRMYFSKGQVSPSDSRLFYSMEAGQGVSGGAIWVPGEKPGCIGIHTGTLPNHNPPVNYGVRITPEIVEWAESVTNFPPG